jgi:signal transduction histidine kinase
MIYKDETKAPEAKENLKFATAASPAGPFTPIPGNIIPPGSMKRRTLVDCWSSIARPCAAGNAGVALFPFLCMLCAAAAESVPKPAEPVPLTSIQQIRELSPEQARAGLPVKVRAVVTFAKPSFATLFIHDGTAGIFVEQTPKKNDPAGLQTGVQLEITGITGEGMFAPVIKGVGTQDPVVTLIGPGTLPEPRLIDGAEMSRPDLDSDWVSIDTWVSEVLMDGSNGILACHSENCDFHVLLEGPLPPESVPWDLAESRIRVRGVVATTFNRGRQMTARFLRVTSISEITPLNPKRADPTEPRLVRPDELMQAKGPGPGDLVRVRGVASLALPGRGLFLQVAGGGLWVQTAQPIAAPPGAVIEVIGWPRPGELKPFIRAHRASVMGTTTPPKATLLKASEALKASHDAEWISVAAELLDSSHGPDGTTLELRDTDVIFRGLVPDVSKIPMPKLKPGSRIRISGISRVTSIGSIILRVEDKLQILARTPADVTLLSPPPFWTVRNVSFLAAAIIAGSFGVLAVSRSRRRREQQTQRREFEAVLAERGRFAREIHDSLAQGLTSVSFQLECVRDQLTADPVSAASHVETARSLVRDSLKEARRTVWNLRPLALAEAALLTALQRFAANLTDTGKIAFHQQIEGMPRSLPPSREDTLLRIGQEALTNAARHASASEISLTLRFGPGWVSLSIKDNGQGFDVATRVGQGFGLTGMHERVAALGGSLAIDSRPGHGTEVSATLPT